MPSGKDDIAKEDHIQIIILNGVRKKLLSVGASVVHMFLEVLARSVTFSVDKSDTLNTS